MSLSDAEKERPLNTSHEKPITKHEVGDEMQGSYTRFLMMILTSAVLMFAFMYLNSYSWEHVHWSTTRFYMTLIMTGTMAIVMLSYMLSMYKNKAANYTIYALGVLLFVLGLYWVRSQSFVGEEKWMSAMIPHHSIAILTSERANINDVRVKKLADEIIKAQEREIKEMKWLLDDIANNGLALSDEDAAKRPVPSY